MAIEAYWFIIIGALLLLVALSKDLIARLPLTGAMIYLVAGFGLGPAGLGMLRLDWSNDVHLMRVITETGLVVSLFSIGLHLRIPLQNGLWRMPLRLGAGAMVVTVGLFTALGVWGLQLGVGAALLLAACVAPTDPVLANELRPREAGDDEPVRFALSSEGGSNDGTTLPVATVGVYLCMTTQSQPAWVFALDVVWGIIGALVIGVCIGYAVSYAVTEVRIRKGWAIGLEGFFALGIMAVCYGAAELASTYAFLAVFASGVTLRLTEQRRTGDERPNRALRSVTMEGQHDISRDRRLAPAYMTQSMMAFTINIEHFVEMALMLVVGSLLSAYWSLVFTWSAIWPVLVLFVVIRPLSVAIALIGERTTLVQRSLIGWLGIRGVGTLYYLLFAVERVGDAFSPRLRAIALAAITLSVIVHGATANLALRLYKD